MAKKVYQCDDKVENASKTAKAMYTNAPASTKFSSEIVRQIRGQPLNKIEARFNRILKHEEPLHLTRYTRKIAHRKGISGFKVKAGRYPEKTIKAWLNLFESVKANADYQGLDADKLLIQHVFSSQGRGRISYQKQGRISGKRRVSKATHLEIVVVEGK